MELNDKLFCKLLITRIGVRTLIPINSPVYEEVTDSGTLRVEAAYFKLKYTTDSVGIRLLKENGVDIEADIYNNVVNEVAEYIKSFPCDTVFHYQIYSYVINDGKKIGFSWRGAMI